MAINYLGHKYQIEDMISSLDAGHETLVTGEEARKSVEIILSIYESARTGKQVNIIS
jgi:predicted dehydrogenase